MQQVYIPQPDDRQEFEVMLRELKRTFNKSGIVRELKLQSIPKRSDRVKEKRRLARVRRGRKMMIAGDDKPFDRDRSYPEWKFVRTGPGEYVKKVIPKRKEKGEVEVSSIKGRGDQESAALVA